MSDQPTDPAQQPARRDRSWLVLALSIAFVVGIVAAFSFAMRDSFSAEPQKAFELSFTDDFDRRANTGGLGTAHNGPTWTIASGLWNVDAGRASIAFPAKDRSLAVIGNLSKPAIMARVSGKQRCGVVARYADPKNFIGLVRVPAYGVWNLVEVRDGKETVLGKLPDVVESTVTVKIETGQRVINAYVGLSTISVAAPSDSLVGAVGLIGYEDAAAQCVFADLWAFSGR